LPPCLSPAPFSEVEFEALIPRPRRNVFCIGKNYHEHVKEFASSGFDSSAAAGVAPKFPIVFSKVPNPWWVTVTSFGSTELSRSGRLRG
jgi:2-keto-4-pentenoate hydratase/2-oxohepta-3-ene-1,7-dioic acid hydratase in catechol pathway